ncbi:hypothetical protein F8388_019647 [Cannabis sativa]|uniref:Uncharacterized protein n=1 Tax=Cannabis sativa TaxID=3483 RepID=A0A7J6DUC3_CANSA|nr:hypothetical protein F8388_019647 [Cannabis sativa]
MHICSFQSMKLSLQPFRKGLCFTNTHNISTQKSLPNNILFFNLRNKLFLHSSSTPPVEYFKTRRKALRKNPRFPHVTAKLAGFTPDASTFDDTDRHEDTLFRAFDCRLTSSPELIVVCARFRHFWCSLAPVLSFSPKLLHFPVQPSSPILWPIWPRFLGEEQLRVLRQIDLSDSFLSEKQLHLL